MKPRARSRFPVDRRLTVRMVITMLLLGLLYALFGAVLLVLLGSWLPVVVILALVLLAQYWFSDRIALYAMHGVVLTPEQEPRLHAILDRLCAQADMPKPALAVSYAELPNAFATGRNPSHSVLCVTTGLTRRLTDDEVEAVLAHELSHVAHRDVVVITIASFVAVLAGLLMRASFYGAVLGGRGRQGAALGAAFAAVAMFSAIVYGLGFILIRALSRYRELAADRSGAILTGQPSSLAHALVKLDAAGTGIPTEDLRRAAAFNAFLITPAGRRGGSLLSTHPDLRTRLDRLAQLATALEQHE
ncbi:MAG TPA: zinc metalloprotease HtpX [Actinospica sp.]|jgi:heat shock protein HtpX|nr:zinc metalloprotease HtpX [Actinospica sp.]